MRSSKAIEKEVEFAVVIDPSGDVSYEYDSDDEAKVRALIRRLLEGPPEPAGAHSGAAEPILADYPEAADLLRTTVSALKTRVSRGDQRLHAAMVTYGRSVRFNVAKLREKFAPKRRP